MSILVREFDLSNSLFTHIVSELVSSARGEVSDSNLKDYLLGNLDNETKETIEAIIIKTALNETPSLDVEDIYAELDLEQASCSSREYEFDLVFL